MANKSTPEASARPRRSPVSGRSILKIRNKEEGYHYRIVNANLERDPERVQDMLEQGYEIVPKEAVGPIGDKRVGNPSTLGSSSEISVGGGTKAVVMRKRLDWHKEDQAQKQQEVDDLEQSMRRQNADYGDIKLVK